MSTHATDDWRAARRKEEADLLAQDTFLIGEPTPLLEDRLESHSKFNLAYCLSCFLCCGNDRKKLHYLDDEEVTENVGGPRRPKGGDLSGRAKYT